MELSPYLKSYPCADKPGRVLLVATRRCAMLELSESILKTVPSFRHRTSDRCWAALRREIAPR
jgi:hypothetical protein